MTKLSRVFVVLLLSTMASSSEPSLADDAFDGFVEKLGGDEVSQASSNKALCDKGFYSANFEKWLKFYLHGKDAEADKEWANVLKITKGATDLDPLMRSVSNRVLMMEDEDADLFLKRGGLAASSEHIVKASEKVLGETVIFASLLNFAAYTFANDHKFDKAIQCAQRVISLHEKLFGKYSYQLKKARKDFTGLLLYAGEFEKAKVAASQMVELGTRLKDLGYIRRGKEFLHMAETHTRRKKCHMPAVKPPRAPVT